MLAEQQSDLVAYNLHTKSKLIELPAVTVVSGLEQTVAKDRPAENKEGRLLPPTSGRQKDDVKLQGGDIKAGLSLLSVTGDRDKGRQALGAKIRSYAPSVNPGHLHILETETIKAELGEIKGLSNNLPSASKNVLGASKKLSSTSVESIDPPLYPQLSGVLE